MKKERILLLLSAIFMIMYSLFQVVYIKFTNDRDTIMNTIIILISVLTVIFNFYCSFTNKNLDNFKIPIMIVSIYCFFMNIISGILGFIAYSKINHKEKRELPKIEIMHNHKWYVYLLSLAICLSILFGFSNLFTNSIQLYLSYIFILALMIFIFRKDLVRDFKLFKEYFREYSLVTFKMYGLSLAVLFIVNISIRMTTGISNATNQRVLNEAFKENPIFIALLAMVYAPISEELMFRGIFRKFLNKKWIFILVSGFLFGLAHVIDDFESISELLFIFSYGTLGCFLAATYYKTNNLCTNIFFHFIQNTLAVLAMILLSYLPGIV